MADSIPVGKTLVVIALTVVVLFAAGWWTREDPGEVPYLRVTGKSFIFNYRVADIYYGFSAYLTKTVPKNSIIEATFEDPAGGEPFVVREKVTVRSRRYGMRSPSLRGVEAHRPYHVRIRLIRWGDEMVLYDEDMTVVSQIADDIVPDKPLTIGPGYHRNPELNQNGS